MYAASSTFRFFLPRPDLRTLAFLQSGRGSLRSAWLTKALNVRWYLTSARINESAVYQIPCSGCDASYFGETTGGLKEDSTDVRHHRKSSALVNHVDLRDHLPDWGGKARVLKSGLGKNKRKPQEAAYIATVPLKRLHAKLVGNKPHLTSVFLATSSPQ